jgi:purine-binding chemotaxis protein CheW
MTPGPVQVLLVRAAARTCALALGSVVETMRPLPIEALAGAPPAVLGLALIRGAPLPVVALGALLGGAGGAVGRFVVIRAGERRVALAVEAVLATTILDGGLLAALPPLLREAQGELVGALGRLDRELLLVLEAARIVEAAALPGPGPGGAA